MTAVIRERVRAASRIETETRNGRDVTSAKIKPASEQPLQPVSLETSGPLEDEIFAFLTRKYVQRADDRHKEMGLQYTSAETHDLAREIAKLLHGRVDQDKPLPARTWGVLGIEGAVTKNMGDFNSARVGIYCELPFEDGTIAGARAFYPILSREVDHLLATELALATGEVPPPHPDDLNK